MRYSGSKGGCGEIAKIIQSFLTSESTYHEPFCGACKVLAHIRCKHRFGSDIDQPIITLLKAVQAGWEPISPCLMNEGTHDYWKERQQEVHPMVGFMGYGCSHGGMFFHKFIHSEDNHGYMSPVETWESLKKQRPKLQGVHLYNANYQDLTWAKLPDVLYLDPPYDGTFMCGSVKKKFDSDEFWPWAVRLSRKTVILVSEYECPVAKAVVVWQKEAQVRAGNNRKRKTKQKVEKLFLLNPDQAHKIGFNVH